MVKGEPQVIPGKRESRRVKSNNQTRAYSGECARVTVLATSMGLPLVIYSLLLIERKWSVLSNTQPFLQTRILTLWEKAAFVAIISAATILLIVISVHALRFLGDRLVGPANFWTTKASLVSVGIVYFGAITSQFRAFQYFQDTLSLALMQHMGGGDVSAGFAYVTNEFTGIFPLVVLWFVLMILGGYLFRRYGLRRPLLRLASLHPVRRLASRTGLLSGMAAMAALPLPLAVFSPALSSALDLSLAYQICRTPVAYLTDVDGDGYGLLGSIRDFAPLDNSRHPHAVEVTANRIDEDGVGGDLSTIIWPKSIKPDWSTDALERKNVLLIVMDSARRDLLDLDTRAGAVMPVLRSLPGEQVQLVSHAGFTVPSIISLFNGTISNAEPGVSLIDHFNRLGYRTAVFSGQHEGFGSIAERTGMRRASVFVDATAFPPERRMYESTTPAALAIPAPMVNARFSQWMERLDTNSPFFAYLNWQEMHFPYHYRGAPRPLLVNPVHRAEITIANRGQVWQTYLNAGRSLDTALSDVVNLLKRVGRWENTVLMVLSDHGEELFEHGYLGHGINLSHEQYTPLCKIINSRAWPPTGPVGIGEVGNILYNALLRAGHSPVPVRGEVLCHTGAIEAPGEIGLMSAEGLVKYNFARRKWLRQSHHGAGFSPALPVNRIIHLWESYRLVFGEAAANGGV